MTAPGNEKDNGAALLRMVCLGFVIAILYRVATIVTGFYQRHPGVFKLALWEGCFILASTVGIAAYNFMLGRSSRKSALGHKPGRIYFGRVKSTQEDLYVDEEIRCKHIELLGPTGEGKTSRAILPWSYSDIEDGRGFLFVDGKGDGQLLAQIYAKVKRCRREKDFHIFSLGHPEWSSTFNPLIGLDARQVTERVFSALTFTDPFYKSLQYDSFHTIINLLMSMQVPVLPGVVRELLRDKGLLSQWKDKINDPGVSRDLNLLLEVPKDTFSNNHSGIVSQLGKFCQGPSAPLFNASHPEISLQECIEKRKIVYFQLPTMRFPELAAATGKLLLQCLESAVSCIHDRSSAPPEKLFSVYLDDFNDFLYPEFVLLLNKSRSANVGVVFSHQSMGDLGKLGDDFTKIFWDSTRTKVFMRAQDPETVERIAKYFGTKLSEASTARRTQSTFGPQYTGEESVRMTQEFHFHPDTIKRLPQGDALVSFPNMSEGYHIRLGPPPRLAMDSGFPKKTHPSVHFVSAAEPKASAPPDPPSASTPDPTLKTAPPDPSHEDREAALTRLDPKNKQPEPVKEV